MADMIMARSMHNIWKQPNGLCTTLRGEENLTPKERHYFFGVQLPLIISAAIIFEGVH